MLRILSILLLCISMQCHADAKSNERALEYYQQAKLALSDGRLNDAERLAKEAISIVTIDRKLPINVRKRYSFVRVGRKLKRQESKTADYKHYAPNWILDEIEKIRKQQFAQSVLVAKRRNPPKLVFEDIRVTDEDNDQTLSALERGRLTFTVLNVGKSTAENVSLKFEVGGTALVDFPKSASIGNLEVGARYYFSQTFSLSKDAPSGEKGIYLSAQEKHGLGEIHEHLIVIQTRPRFTPQLRIQQLSAQSEVIYPYQPATLRYEIVNHGMDTVWDIDLSLNPSLAGKVHILNDIDLQHIPQLRVGERRIFTFTIEPTHSVAVGHSLGIDIVADSRGEASYRQYLALTVTGAKRVSASDKNKLLALRRPVSIPAVTRSDESVAVIISGIATPKPGQLNNIKSAKRMFQQQLGIKADRMLLPALSSMSGWRHFFEVTLSEALDAHAGSELHIYVDTEGYWDAVNDTLWLHMNPSDKHAFEIELTDWLAQIARLPAKHINVYLEAPFTQGNGALPLMVNQSLITSPYSKVTLYSAATKGELALSDVHSGTGIFTYLLERAFAQTQTLANSHAERRKAIGRYLREKLPFFSQQLHGRIQLGAN